MNQLLTLAELVEEIERRKEEKETEFENYYLDRDLASFNASKSVLDWIKERQGTDAGK